MSSCPAEDDLVRMVEGVLGTESLAVIEAHVDGCEQCAAVIANFGALDSAAAKPRMVGRYQLDRRIGGGGMGEVWAAWDPQLRRDIAVKLVKPERADDGREADRLKREARALARLGHPNVLAVYDVGEVDGEVFIATELVVGDTLASRGGANADWRELVRLYAQAARGLAAAHAAGLVHRDIKPANLLIGTDGRVRVADFGLAVRSYTPSPAAPPDGAGGGDDKITQTGYIAGTPAYMAPEQRLGEPADARADQYALCVALAEGIAGRRPPLDLTADALIAFVGERRPHEDDLARACTVIARGLSIIREERFPDMTELASALEACLAAATTTATTAAAVPQRRRRTGLIVGLAAAAGVASVLVGWRMTTRDVPQARPPIATTIAAPAALPADAAMVGAAPLPADARALTTSSQIPAPPQPPQPANLDEALVAARKATLRRDGTACLAALDRVPATLPAPTRLALEVQRAQCEMLRGDCERGIARMDAALEAQGFAPTGRAQAIANCPIEGSLETRLERLLAQGHTASTPALCKRYVAPAKTLAGEVASPQHKVLVAGLLRQLGRCAGDCGEAEALWTRAYELDQIAAAWDVKNCAAPHDAVPPQPAAATDARAFSQVLQRTHEAIARHDVAACRAFVAKPPKPPSGMETSLELLAGYCTMVAGDCKAGSDRIAKVQPISVTSAESTYCPIAGSLDDRIRIMRGQLSAFADMRTGGARIEWCNVIVPAAKQAAREVQTAAQREQVAKALQNLAWCVSLVGRCGEANELVSLATATDPDAAATPQLSAKCP